MEIEQIIQFINFDRLPLALLVLVVGLFGLRVIGGFLDDLGERITDRRLLFKKSKAMIRFVTYIVLFVATTTSVLDLRSEAVYAVAGSIGLAVGFALKDLAASLMAGVILLIDEPFQVGDRIAFDGYYGEVTEIGLRSVRLATLDDNAVTIPNNKFLTDSVASANAGALDAMVVMSFFIAAAEDFQRARRLATEATVTSRYVYLRKPVTSMVEDVFLGERFVTKITLKAYVFDVRYEKAFGTDVTERVKLAFREAGLRGPDQAYRDLELNWGREAPRERPQSREAQGSPS